MGILRTNEISGLETPTAVTGSVSFDGTGDNLSFSLSSGGLGSGDFTLEYFVYQNTLSDYQTHFGVSRGVNGFNVGTDASGDFVLYSASARQIEVVGAITTGRWYHWAFVRSGSTLTGYLDGRAIDSYSSSENFSGTTCTIGSLESNSEYTNGYISNFRILKGTALYTSNFTPPVHELQRIGDTVLLCCNNPDSAGAEATGKTITVNGDAAASTFSPGLTRDFTSGTQFEGVAKFDTQGYFVPPSGTTEQRGRGRGLFGGGTISPGASNLNSIEYIQIQTQGTAQDFGDLSTARRGSNRGSVSSSTRGISGGGYDTGNTNIIEFVSIATASNTVDFGDLSTGRNIGSTSNSTRGIFAGGDPAPRATVIDFITIASKGDATTFGTLTARSNLAGCASPTRALFGGGYVSGTGSINTIEYVTIASTGNPQDFGDLTVIRYDPVSWSSSTRAVFAGGGNPTPTLFNTIDFVTIATIGNAQDFGDLTSAKQTAAGASDSIRGVFAGDQPTFTNTMEYLTIASTGNTKDFGDLITGRSQLFSCSDSHGGLS